MPLSYKGQVRELGEIWLNLLTSVLGERDNVQSPLLMGLRKGV